MKTLKSLLLIAFVSFFQVSCNQEKESEIRKELMKIHDQEMLNMDELMKLKKSITDLSADTMISDDAQATIQTSIKELKAADNAMMDWMHNYKEPDKTVSFEEKEKYYAAELVKMKALSVQMNESISKAKSILNDYENK